MQGKLEGNTLTLTIDVSKAAREAAKPSGSGKTLLIDSSHGFARFGDIQVSLNATLPNPAYVAVPKAK